MFAHFLPNLVDPAELRDAAVVVLDVLRASTVVCHALRAGAREVIPCLEIDDARAVAAALPGGTAVLGGERGGLRIEGFDLGNSPGEYTPEAVAGRTIVLTTTNGTRALQHARQARQVWVAALVNLGAVARGLRRRAAELDVHLLCAGTRGQVTGEDVLAAGGLACRLLEEPSTWVPGNDQLRIAMALWQSLGAKTAQPHALAQYLRDHTQGGRNVAALGLSADLAAAAAVDTLDVAPQLDMARWCITAAP
jgi:2-phosphosulfolactate phosphatase